MDRVADRAVDRAAEVVARTDCADFAARLQREAEAGQVLGVGAGAATVTRLGAGESYTAWLVRTKDGARHQARVVRVPRRGAGEMPPSMDREYAALARVPPDLGAHGVAVARDPDNPLRAPYMVTTYVPGRVLPAGQWTPRLACALAEQVARLHHLLDVSRDSQDGAAHGAARRPPAAGDGPASGTAPESPSGGGASERSRPPGGGTCPPPGTGAHPALTTRSATSREADSLLAWWHDHCPGTVADPRVASLLSPWRQALVRLDPASSAAPLHPLVHGDVVVTNVVVGPDGAPRLIDWEWAAPGDPAKDLALVGGGVTGGPWYAHLSRRAVTALVARYVVVRAGLAGSRGAEPDSSVSRVRCGYGRATHTDSYRDSRTDGRSGCHGNEDRGRGGSHVGHGVHVDHVDHVDEVRWVLERRDAWELLDRMDNLLYCLSRGGQGAYGRWAEELAASLAAHLGPEAG